VTVGLFFAVVFVRALFKDDASVTIAMWFFWWPICFMWRLPGISNNTLVWLSLVVGVLLDIAFISFVTYCVLRAIMSRQHRAHGAIPPQPPTF
jgi:hypothetical protein